MIREGSTKPWHANSFSAIDDTEINFAANRMARKEGAMGQELITYCWSSKVQTSPAASTVFADTFYISCWYVCVTRIKELCI